MAAPCMMKLLHEKTLPSKVATCVWSPKMDLLALANSSGQVMLHRLSWQKVWTYIPEGNNSKVIALAWRPDSKILAVAYSSGNVVFLNVEDGSNISSIDIDGEISFLQWSSHQESKQTSTEDPWLPFMYCLPYLGKTLGDELTATKEDGWQDPILLHNQNCLTLLSFGTTAGVLYIYAYGLFHIVTIHINDYVPNVGKVYDICVSDDMASISLYVEKVKDDERYILHLDIDSSLLRDHHAEISSLSQKYGQIFYLITYAKLAISHMEEAWESTLLEMDSKLESYATKVSVGGVSADLLELLIFGYTSTELEIFLAKNVTEKGLKKLQTCVILSYSNMQKLLTKNLKTVGLSLIFLLSHMSGMAKLKEKYQVLGVKEDIIMEAIRESASFLLKAGEMLQVINASLQDFLNFLRWMSSSRLRYTLEPLSPDTTRFTQQEMSRIISFLSESFEETKTDEEGRPVTRFKLERVGQYLLDEELKITSSNDETPWIQFLKSNPELSKHSLIFKHRPNLSLIQELNLLSKKLILLGSQSMSAISRSVKVTVVHSILQFHHQAPKVDQIFTNKSFLASIVLNSTLLVNKWSLTHNTQVPSLYAAIYSFSPVNVSDSITGVKLAILDMHYYSEYITSVLLLERGITIFAQLLNESLALNLPEITYRTDTSCLMDSNLVVRDATNFLHTSSFKCLDKVNATTFTISGARKVSVMLSESKRRIYIYEMETEEDDDMEDTTNSSVHLSVLTESNETL